MWTAGEEIVRATVDPVAGALCSCKGGGWLSRASVPIVRVGWLPLALLSILGSAGAQILIRQVMRAMGAHSGLVSVITYAAGRPAVWLALMLYGASLAVWLAVLARVPASVAYPVASIGYVVVALFGYVFLREPLSGLKLVGLAAIVGGAVLISH